MATQTSDIAKAYTIQAGLQPSASSGPNLEMALQGLMIDDTELKNILKGEIQIPLNRFREIVEDLNQIVVECFKKQLIDSSQGQEILARVQEIRPLMEKIDMRLTRYYKMVPYLLVLSPLTRLSNLTVQIVEGLKRKVGIMIGRDKLMASGSDESFEDANFWDALEIACCIAIQDSLGGWKMQGVVTEKRQVSTIIEERGPQKKKHWWQP